MSATNDIDLRSNSANRPLKDLVSGLGRDTGLLIRQELELAKVELKEYGSHMAKAGAGIGSGAAITYLGAFSIVAAMVLLLIKAGVEPWMAAAVIGVATGLAGYAVLQGARRRLSAPPSTLPRTQQTTKETVQWAKEQLP